LTSLVSAVMLPRAQSLTTFRFWQIGGVGGAVWDRILLLLPALVLGVILVHVCARGMNSLALGDDVATGLGENVARTRIVSAAGAFILCGAATAIAGPIAFVGLIVPHLCRLLIGTDHRWLLPFTAVIGAGLLVAADVVGRVIARPDEVEVGIVTALLGAPVFIAPARRRKVRALCPPPCCLPHPWPPMRCPPSPRDVAAVRATAPCAPSRSPCCSWRCSPPRS